MNTNWSEFRKGFQDGLKMFGPPAIAILLILLSWAFFTGYLPI
jgi:hypothetical protein